MPDPVLYGYDSSVYVRIVRLTLAEKGVACDYVRVASFDGSEKYPENEGLHPFRRVPVFEHDGFRLHEARAIAEYIEDAFEGPKLMPADPLKRAVVRQVVSVYDNYCHGPWVQALVTERLFPGPSGPVAERIENALEDARHAARVVDRLVTLREDGGMTLADLHLAPGVHYLAQTPEGAEILADCANLRAWWAAMSARPSAFAILTLPG